MIDPPPPIPWTMSETMVAGFIQQWGGIVLSLLGALGFVLPENIRAMLGDPQTVQQIAGAVVTLGMVCTAFLGWIVQIGRRNGGKVPSPIAPTPGQVKALAAVGSLHP